MNFVVDQVHARPNPWKAKFSDLTKYIFDITVASCLIFFLFPLMAILSSIVALDKGPVLFMHRRVGRQGVLFPCLKFRTMRPDAEAALAALLVRDATARDEWQANRKLKKDPRVTKVGRILRATSLDELPQLFNVLRGDMSLVGPRPVQQDELDSFYADGDARAAYLSMRPGITGLWQVHGRNDISYADRVALDRTYASKHSLLCDLHILLRTVAVVARRAGAY